MDEARPWGKGAREGTGGCGSAGGQGIVWQVTGGIKAVKGIEKAEEGKRREEELTFG